MKQMGSAVTRATYQQEDESAASLRLLDLSPALLSNFMRHMEGFSRESVLKMSLTCRHLDHIMRTDNIMWRRAAETEFNVTLLSTGHTAYRSYQFCHLLKIYEGKYIMNEIALKPADESPHYLDVKLLDIEFSTPTDMKVSCWTFDDAKQVIRKGDPGFMISLRPEETERGLIELSNIDKKYRKDNWEIMWIISIISSAPGFLSILFFYLRELRQYNLYEEQLKLCWMKVNQSQTICPAAVVPQSSLCRNLEQLVANAPPDFSSAPLLFIIIFMLLFLPTATTIFNMIWIEYYKKDKWTLEDWVDKKCDILQPFLRKDSFVKTMDHGITQGYLIPLRTVCSNALDRQYLMAEDGSWPQSLPRPGLYECNAYQVTVGYSAHTMRVARLVRQRTDWLKEDLCVQVSSAMTMTIEEQQQMDRDAYLSFDKGLGGNPNRLTTQFHQVHLPSGNSHINIGDCLAWYTPVPAVAPASGRMRWKLLVLGEDEFLLVTIADHCIFTQLKDIL